MNGARTMVRRLAHRAANMEFAQSGRGAQLTDSLGGHAAAGQNLDVRSAAARRQASSCGGGSGREDAVDLRQCLQPLDGRQPDRRVRSNARWNVALSPGAAASISVEGRQVDLARCGESRARARRAADLRKSAAVSTSRRRSASSFDRRSFGESRSIARAGREVASRISRTTSSGGVRPPTSRSRTISSRSAPPASAWRASSAETTMTSSSQSCDIATYIVGRPGEA